MAAHNSRQSSVLGRASFKPRHGIDIRLIIFGSTGHEDIEVIPACIYSNIDLDDAVRQIQTNLSEVSAAAV